jgi:hypothetical protein
VLTPRKNKYLLTFIDHFTKYFDAITISDQSAETLQGFKQAKSLPGLKLTTDEGRAFMSTFFQAT